jgi:hypothetical protein
MNGKGHLFVTPGLFNVTGLYIYAAGKDPKQVSGHDGI